MTYRIYNEVYCFQFSSVQFSRSVTSNSLWTHESQHARPPCPSPSPGAHPDSHPSSPWCHPAISSSVIPFSSCPHYIRGCCCCLDAKLCLTLCNPMDCNPPGSSIHGISQASVLEWVAISFSTGSSQSRDWTYVCCIERQILYHCATRGAPLYTIYNLYTDRHVIYTWISY